MAIEVGIIGCGGMGRVHARHLAAMPGVRLRAYADPRTEAARALLDQHGGDYIDEDAAQLLADDGLDAVFICTHHHLHHPTLPITDAIVATLRFANGAVSSAVVGDFGRPALAGKAFYELFGGDRTGTIAGSMTTPCCSPGTPNRRA